MTFTETEQKDKAAFCVRPEAKRMTGTMVLCPSRDLPESLFLGQRQSGH